MIRTEFNCATGESVEIAQAAYKDAEGRPVILDVGQPTDGLTAISLEELSALTASVPPTFEVQKKALLASFRADRERMVARLDLLANKAFRAGDPGKAEVCDVLTDALVDITTHPTVTSATNMDALELAMETLYDAAVYAAITNPAAPTLLSDFARMDK